MKDWIVVGLGGGLGAVVRYAILLLIPSGLIPWNVFIINITGSLVIGVVMALTVEFAQLTERIR